jgi:regulatory protein
MKIEIISVNALGEGAEMLIGVAITGDSGMSEKRKFLLFAEQYLELGLCRGAVIDADTFDKLEEMSKRCVAMRKGSDLLAYSSSSRVRLAQRLRQKGIDRESAEDAARRLEELGLIDEEADVESLVRSCLKKLWGKKRIYRELCAKGYDRDVVSRELEGVDDETLVNNCVALFRKKHKVFPSDPETQKKIIASLVRYGYSFGEIKKALQIIEK